MLGISFLLNQVDETYSTASTGSSVVASATLSCLYLHLSHLVACSCLFLALLGHASATAEDALSDLALVYWHLVEVVWVVILFGLMAV